MKFLQHALFSASRVGRKPIRILKKGAGRTASFKELEKLWSNLIRKYFPKRLDLLDYKFTWSIRRQKRTLGSCNISRRKVIIARELNSEMFQKWVEPVLYHELCHAVLGDKAANLNGRRCWHGAEFKRLEALHPQTDDLNGWIKSGGWSRAVRCLSIGRSSLP